jgi:hypothetical protein
MTVAVTYTDIHRAGPGSSSRCLIASRSSDALAKERTSFAGDAFYLITGHYQTDADKARAFQTIGMSLMF